MFWETVPNGSQPSITGRHGHRGIPFEISSSSSSPFVKSQFQDLFHSPLDPRDDYADDYAGDDAGDDDDSPFSIPAVLWIWGGNEGIVDELLVYTLDPPTWRTIKTQGISPDPCAGFACDLDTRDGNQIAYIFGGVRETEFFDQFSNSLYAFDLKTFTWEEISTSPLKPLPQIGGCANIVKGKLYLFGGISQRLNLISDTMVLDLKLGTWEKLRTKGSAPSPRDAAASVVIGEKIYYHGGVNASSRLADLYSLNTETTVWEKIAVQGLTSGRSHHSAVALNSKIIVFGGWVPAQTPGDDAPGGKLSSASNDLFVIDCENDYQTETITTNGLPSPRTGHAAVMCGDKLLIFGGRGDLRPTGPQTVYSDCHQITQESGGQRQAGKEGKTKKAKEPGKRQQESKNARRTGNEGQESERDDRKETSRAKKRTASGRESAHREEPPSPPAGPGPASSHPPASAAPPPPPLPLGNYPLPKPPAPAVLFDPEKEGISVSWGDLPSDLKVVLMMKIDPPFLKPQPGTTGYLSPTVTPAIFPPPISPSVYPEVPRSAMFSSSLDHAGNFGHSVAREVEQLAAKRTERMNALLAQTLDLRDRLQLEDQKIQESGQVIQHLYTRLSTLRTQQAEMHQYPLGNPEIATALRQQQNNVLLQLKNQETESAALKAVYGSLTQALLDKEDKIHLLRTELRAMGWPFHHPNGATQRPQQHQPPQPVHPQEIFTVPPSSLTTQQLNGPNFAGGFRMVFRGRGASYSLFNQLPGNRYTFTISFQNQFGLGPASDPTYFDFNPSMVPLQPRHHHHHQQQQQQQQQQYQHEQQPQQRQVHRQLEQQPLPLLPTNSHVPAGQAMDHPTLKNPTLPLPEKEVKPQAKSQPKKRTGSQEGGAQKKPKKASPAASDPPPAASARPDETGDQLDLDAIYNKELAHSSPERVGIKNASWEDLREGERVEFMDRSKNWYVSRIARKFAKGQTQKITVHYEGWSKRHDEIMEIDLFRERVREYSGTALVGRNGEETDEFWAEYVRSNNNPKSDSRQAAKAKGD